MSPSKKKAQTVFVCDVCGEEYIQWQGKCSSCNNWNTLKEFHIPAGGSTSSSGSQSGYGGNRSETPQRLGDIAGERLARKPSGIGEFDRVLGGGIVPGSVVLLGGDPGIGKSTLLLQLAALIKEPVLYVSGEESPEQIKLRAERLKIDSPLIQLQAATNVDTVTRTMDELKPALVIIDSIQTMYDPAYPSTPGSLVQVRETAIKIQQAAKGLNVPVVLVGHITKEGTVAGPRTLEHLVDVVLYLEGDPQHNLRVLRGVKNRFGAVDETGLFAMAEEGLLEVQNPAGFLLGERVVAPGSVLTAVLEGSRPVLVEVQALTTPTVFGYPRRTVSGFDLNRLNLLLAVLQRRAGIDLSSHDVFVNIVGGLKVKDPGVDAAICVAIASARQGTAVAEKLVVVGEVGLAGEIRVISQQERREKEAKQLGFVPAKRSKELRTLLAAVLPKGAKGTFEP